MNRRTFSRLVTMGALSLGIPKSNARAKPREIAITMDDFNFRQSGLPAEERSARLLATLRSEHSKIAAFVIGRNAEMPEGDKILR